MYFTRNLTVGALIVNVVSIQPATLSSRQTATQGNVDVCVELINFPLRVTIHNGIPPVTIGLIGACVCLSGLPNFISSNVVASAAVAIAGLPATTAALTAEINKSGQTCDYPVHATAQCKAGNPCSSTCTDGYTTFPAGSNLTDCICQAPKSECNGKCTSALCPSAGLRRRDAHEHRKRGKKCNLGWTACGVFGGARVWECVDTQNDLESCGGCIVPLWQGAPGRSGQDCSALPGVQDVSCVRGHCRVHRCESGYVLDANRSACVRTENIDSGRPAVEYGLEHKIRSKH